MSFRKIQFVFCICFLSLGLIACSTKAKDDVQNAATNLHSDDQNNPEQSDIELDNPEQGDTDQDSPEQGDTDQDTPEQSTPEQRSNSGQNTPEQGNNYCVTLKSIQASGLATGLSGINTGLYGRICATTSESTTSTSLTELIEHCKANTSQWLWKEKDHDPFTSITDSLKSQLQSLYRGIRGDRGIATYEINTGNTFLGTNILNANKNTVQLNIRNNTSKIRLIFFPILEDGKFRSTDTYLHPNSNPRGAAAYPIIFEKAGTELNTAINESRVFANGSKSTTFNYEIERGNCQPGQGLIAHQEGENQELLRPGREYNFLSWNVFKAGKPNFYSDFTRLISEFEIVLTQESLLEPDFLDALIASPLKWFTAVSFTDSNGYGTGVSFASSLKTKDHKALKSIPREPGLNTPKMSAYFRVPISGSSKSIFIVNIHAINFVSTTDFKSHIDQVSAEIAQHNGPVILAGDFNTWMNTRKAYLLAKARELSLTTVEFSNEFRDVPLDYIFTRGVTVTQSAILDEVITSDHFPLSLRFKFVEN